MIKATAHPYGVDLYFYTDSTEWKRDSKHSVKGCAGLTVWGNEGIMIYVGDNNLATLVHELTHTVLYVLTWCGIDPADSNGEPMAYLMDYLFTAFKDAVNVSN